MEYDSFLSGLSERAKLILVQIVVLIFIAGVFALGYLATL